MASNPRDAWTSTPEPHRSFPTRLRDKLKAVRHLVDLRAQIIEHPWHAVAAAILLGAWAGVGETITAREAERTGRRHIPSVVKAMLVDAALTIAREALARQVANIAKTEPAN